ncbi:hypothetical protein GGX14DRAFT_546386 [Mycena pura]|uniref:Uncharacterized protein n=1 Tax=Mycena pura TaxID=153505 RepID=A0AAD6Y067_9AGAR|nr:hypothetical protein GGX14DRAFT_546386 [Mycena pura]
MKNRSATFLLTPKASRFRRESVTETIVDAVFDFSLDLPVPHSRGSAAEGRKRELGFAYQRSSQSANELSCAHLSRGTGSRRRCFKKKLSAVHRSSRICVDAEQKDRMQENTDDYICTCLNISARAVGQAVPYLWVVRKHCQWRGGTAEKKPRGGDRVHSANRYSGMLGARVAAIIGELRARARDLDETQLRFSDSRTGIPSGDIHRRDRIILKRSGHDAAKKHRLDTSTRAGCRTLIDGGSYKYVSGMPLRQRCVQAVGGGLSRMHVSEFVNILGLGRQMLGRDSGFAVRNSPSRLGITAYLRRKATPGLK